MRVLGAVVGLVVILSPASISSGQQTSPSLLKATFGRLPIYFVENRGLYPHEVKFYVQGTDKTLFFTSKGVTFALRGKERAWTVKLDFEGAKPNVEPRGMDRQQAVLSYFKGPERDWKTGLPTFARIVYEELWPGIDLVYRGNVNQLKYEFVVQPGADPGQIKLRYRGATDVRKIETGRLRVETPVAGFEDAPPVAWQEIDGKRRRVAVAYSLNEDGGFGFDLGDYDRTWPLVLDPAILVYCGYIGGNTNEDGDGIAVDAAGNAYVTGHTDSGHAFPARVGPDLSYNGGPGWGDAFVAKVNAQGTGLVYCGFIGGSGGERGRGIAVDAAGNAYVTGWTESDEQTFPVKVGPDLTFNGGSAFVGKVNPQGTGLVYCGYIDGASAMDIAVDGAGNAYVTGTASNTLPVKVGPDLTSNSPIDGFVAKVNATGKELDYCGYIGGYCVDSGSGIAVDAAGNAYVTGYTCSTEQTFPVKVGPDLTHNSGLGSEDAFVAKVNAKGTGLLYCGYIGGSLRDKGIGVAVDAAGNAYVVGQTSSDEKTFPVKMGPDLTHNGGGWVQPCDAFVAKVNAKGTGLAYCGYIGGSADETCMGIAVDAAGNAYVMGQTASDEKTFPVKVGPDLTHNGGVVQQLDAFVAKVNAQGTGLVYCGYIGGSGDDFAGGIAVDASGSTYVTGWTTSTETTFPVKVGPDLTHNGPGYGDAFVAKVVLLDNLTASGTARPGGRVTLNLAAVEVSGLPYQLGTSLGTGPIQIDTRQIDLSPDSLLLVSTSSYWPSIFSGYRGVIDSMGQAQAVIHIPNIPALIGVRLHSAFVTLDPVALSGIRSISNTFSFVIAKQ